MKKKIFIVDDDDFFSTMMEDHLSKNVLIETSKFPTGELCLANLHEKPYAVVLDYNLDSQIKGAANGLTILKQIKKLVPETHVILLSSQSKYGVAATTISEGADHYIIKDNDAFKAIDSIFSDLL